MLDHVLYLVLLSFWCIFGCAGLYSYNVVSGVVYLGIFSVISAILFVILNAPDVAMIELSMGIFTSVFCYVCVVKLSKIEYSSLSVDAFSIMIFIIAFSICILVFYLTSNYDGRLSFMKDHFLLNSFRETGVKNTVTAIVSFYRALDTMCEIFIVFISAIGISTIISDIKIDS